MFAVSEFLLTKDPKTDIQPLMHLGYGQHPTETLGEQSPAGLISD